uniref:AEC family transporter n=1 Tax=Thermofilum pendens TaxID=2269 RepID=A0A7C4FBD2_THEPE
MLQALAQVYLLLGVGAAYGALRKPGESEVAFTEKLLLDILLPAVMLSSIRARLFKTGDLSAFTLTLLGATTSLLVLSAAAAAKLSREETLTAMYANTGYIPLGIAQMLWGEAGVSAVSFYVAGNNLAANLLAPIVLGGRGLREGVRRAATFPPLYGLLAGAVLGLSGLPLPAWVESFLGSLASSAAPLALIVVGVEFSRSWGGFAPRDLTPYAFRLIVAVPLAVSLTMLGMLGDLDAKVALLESVMPSAASCVPVARRLSLDAAKVSRVVFVSTVVSTTLSTPLVLVLLG